VPPNNSHGCQLCGLQRLHSFDEFAALPRVTSDCFPFRPGGHLAVCDNCGHIQKLAEPTWHEEISEIYGRYALFHQGGGNEQIVVDPVLGQPRRRSELLVDRLARFVDFAAPGKSFIDIGCGTGALLRAVSSSARDWALYGLEYDDRGLPALRAIAGFRHLYTGGGESVPDGMHLAAMVHVLEHLEQPVQYLRQLRPKLAPGGMLFVQVPNAADNPLDLLIADHMSHFQFATLQFAASRGGFEIVSCTGDWVPKELSLLVKPTEALPPTQCAGSEKARGLVRHQLNWLKRFVERAQRAAADARSFGLFGTSIAATWLFPFVADRVRFFVDEDASRQGKEYLGRPVVAPAQVGADATVFMAMVPKTAAAVAKRLAPSAFTVAQPPELTAIVH